MEDLILSQKAGDSYYWKLEKKGELWLPWRPGLRLPGQKIRRHQVNMIESKLRTDAFVQQILIICLVGGSDGQGYDCPDRRSDHKVSDESQRESTDEETRARQRGEKWM